MQVTVIQKSMGSTTGRHCVQKVRQSGNVPLSCSIPHNPLVINKQVNHPCRHQRSSLFLSVCSRVTTRVERIGKLIPSVKRYLCGCRPLIVKIRGTYRTPRKRRVVDQIFDHNPSIDASNHETDEELATETSTSAWELQQSTAFINNRSAD